MTKNSPKDDNSEVAGLSEAPRTLASLLLFVHCFVVFVCLSANLSPSVLQRRLLAVLRPYAQLLNLEVDGTHFFLTRASVADVDHRIEVLPKEGSEQEPADWRQLSAGWRGGERYRRYRRLADVMAYYAEDEQTAGLIAQSVAGYYRWQRHVDVHQLRCREHLLQPWEVVQRGTIEEQDPFDASYFGVLYLADIIAGEQRIDVLKRADASLEAAPD